VRITVERYPNPVTSRGYDYMAHDADPDTCAGIYGYGNTEAAARADFDRQLVAELQSSPDLTNMAFRAGWLTQLLISAQVRMAFARSQDTKATRDRWFDRLDRDITDALRQIDEANAATRAKVDACRAAGPVREYLR
jgi:hypothetical protein